MSADLSEDTTGEGGWETVTSNPESLWALPEDMRHLAVMELLRQCAGHFERAVKDKRPNVAQDAAMHAIASIAGLFPDRNDPAHRLLLGLSGALLAARSGSRDHILLVPSKDIHGAKLGFHHAYVAGFSISAVGILVDLGLSAHKARTEVARIWADLEYGVRTGEHGKLKPLTASAIRGWQEQPDVYPGQQHIAESMSRIHRENIRNREISTVDDILAYLRDSARLVLDDKGLM